MLITLRYFAAIREITRRSSEIITLPPGATAADAQAWISSHYPPTASILARCQVARNRAFVEASTVLADGDEVVFLPPMAGGEGENIGGGATQ